MFAEPHDADQASLEAPHMREMTYADAVDEAVAEEMRRDPTRLLHGDRHVRRRWSRSSARCASRHADLRGAHHRHGLGAAGSGMRPIVRLATWSTFSFVAMDQIVNQARKIRYMFGGQAEFPVTFRAPSAAARGSPPSTRRARTRCSMHLAGLKMILPSTPADTKGLLKSAIRDEQPGDLLRVQAGC